MDLQKIFYGIILVGCIVPVSGILVGQKSLETEIAQVENETKVVNTEANQSDVTAVNMPKAMVKEETKPEVSPAPKAERMSVAKPQPKVQTVAQVQKSHPEAEIVYDGLTLDQLANKLNKSLNSTIAGKGMLYASYSLQKGVDPYVAVAITLQETGCSWNCSKLVRQCNNVGGMKGSPGCNGGSYKRFNTIDEGIKSFIDNLSRNYYKKGLDTVEEINTKYATSKTWSSKINSYVNKIKSK